MNYSWICLQPVLLALRRPKIIPFFVKYVTATFVLKIVIFKNMTNHGPPIGNNVRLTLNRHGQITNLNLVLQARPPSLGNATSQESILP
ncbi:MAG: hypothetical protein WAK17_14370 [Candidatus Nitrosopolaris sp.]